MKNLNITTKLIIFVSILGIVCVFAIGYVSIIAADKILTEAANNRIKAIENTKKAQVETYLLNKMKSLESLKKLPIVIEVFKSISEKQSTSESLTLDDARKYSNIFKSYIEVNGLIDLFFVSVKEGSVDFDVASNSLQNTKLSQESNKLSNLWRDCLNTNSVLITDMELDHNNVPAMYVGSRISKDGETIGVIIASIDLAILNNILLSDIGMTETGETYLVGEDRFFRSDSRFTNKPTTLDSKVQTIATNKVFNGQSEIEIIKDYRETEVLSYYDLIDINGLKWAIITEIDEEEIMAPKNDLINSILFISILVLVVMFPSLYFIGRMMVKPLNLEIEYAEKLAAGELDAELDINQKDEMGILADALREMATKTSNVIVSVVDAANNLADASFQLSGTSQNISTGASQQASSIEEVSASIEEMTSNIQQNADNAKQTEGITNNVSDQVINGSEIILSSVESMEKIADKISIISDIAFQTNILALNASVEAARAGEYGKGFGVVASEVGKLADKTKAAASEINEISKSSVEIARKTKELMGDIVPSIQNSSLLVQEISAASKEQRDAADQINQAIQLLNDVSQQNAASSEEMATNSEEMSSQAEQLLNVIAHFKVDATAHFHRSTKTANKQKLISRNKQSKTNKDAESYGGVDINLNDSHDLDNEFEKF